MHPLVSAIHDLARHDPGKASLRWKCNDFPYAAVDRQINTLALAMQLKGVRAGEIVAFEASSGPDSVVSMAALWALGAAGFPIRSVAGGPLPAHAVLAGATGFLHPEGNYIKSAAPGHEPPVPASLWLHTGIGTRATVVDHHHFNEVLEGAEKKFSLSSRTVLGLTDIAQPGSMLDLWAVLAAGGTVDLLNDYETLPSDCLLQHLRETGADLLIAHPALPERLSDTPGAVFTQFRDVVVLEGFDLQSRTTLANAFPCSIFHLWDSSTDIEGMSDDSPSDFVDGTNYKIKDPHA
ncbi:hypothetical protein JOF48_001254 [Arthrobacter stackebrandtii]|uniref:AMP-dependent synthetase/ligase domain-containing protein n=1 Tax=Arthrobacter stackebrandtii TaxID=272161 RepID=A0ABS4YV29_9MICC|nr:hypothetical protein [Arthrobacter stackebrandtii]MBP2412455.1 hypothetical protein [Arthrobacter stackebrandtii]PYH02215.1 hypothetical protein CVV67_01925 [Arthrobacter stackebrandtii]